MTVDTNGIVAAEDNGLTVTFGTGLSSKIRETHDANCSDRDSDQCKNEMQKVLGLGSGSNGVQKRVIGTVALLGGVALSYLVWIIMDRIDNAMKGEKIQVVIPDDQKKEVSEWTIDEGKFKFGKRERCIQIPLLDIVTPADL